MERYSKIQAVLRLMANIVKMEWDVSGLPLTPIYKCHYKMHWDAHWGVIRHASILWSASWYQQQESIASEKVAPLAFKSKTGVTGLMSLYFFPFFKKTLIYPLNRRRLCWRDGDRSRCWRAAASSSRPTASLIRTNRTTPRCLPVILMYNKSVVCLWYSCCRKRHIKCSKYFAWQIF